MTSPDLTGKFLGSLIGKALGDAIGELAFTLPSERALRARLAGADPLIYTDDTAMAIGLAESLLEVGDVDPERLGRRFHENHAREPWRGYGAGPPALFAAVAREHITYQDAARRLYGGEGSLGNGAAMRVAPVGLFFHRTEAVAEKARRSASVTHCHPVGMDGAAIQASAVALATRLDPGAGLSPARFCADLLAIAETPEMRARLECLSALLGEGAEPAHAARELGRGVAMQDSLPFALFAFLSHPNSFEDCLFTSALNGGDRDTLAAMACAVCGAYLGVAALPRDWRARLENGDYLETLAGRLATEAW